MLSVLGSLLWSAPDQDATVLRVGVGLTFTHLMGDALGCAQSLFGEMGVGLRCDHLIGDAFHVPRAFSRWNCSQI